MNSGNSRKQQQNITDRALINGSTIKTLHGSFHSRSFLPIGKKNINKIQNERIHIDFK